MKNEKLGKRGYKKYNSKATDYLNDKDKASKLLDDARKKADKKKGPLSGIWEKVQLFFSIFDDWIKGRYKTIPTKSIIMIIVAITYFVFPLDLLPDFIIGLGFIDDIAVLGFVINQINNDLDEYKGLEVWL
jgi:uncharacterized membrane protein YkvA (DUF1232 family)